MAIAQAVISALGAVLVAVVGGLFARDTARRKKSDAEIAADRAKQEARAEVRAQESKLAMEMMSAAIDLGVATGIAVKEQHVNGEMTAAMDKAKRAQREYYKFLNAVAAKQIVKG